ncbi:hypothetical protein NFI96_017683 [Prochilodus magdalenae]|nr:hypothetical protein NFI96_017683 [Prochilodus magdalenae]
MLRNGPAGSVTTTETPDLRSERGVTRLRLTLRPDDIPNGQKDPVKSTPQSEEKMVNGSWTKRNGLMQRERPPGRESPVENKRWKSDPSCLPQHSCRVSNGVGPRVYGVVQRTGDQEQQEVAAREWSVNHLRDEMRYIREVRDSLEKVRERMYGQFGGMQQSMQKLSQELRMANSQKRYLEAEVKTGRQAMDSFDQMNSSLISANIDLQKALLDSCNGRVGNREEMRALRSSFEKTEERLRERERQLADAQAENRALKLQVESSQEASARAMKEMSAKLQQQYEEQLQEQQRKHRQEIEALQAQLEDYMMRLEEAEMNVKLAHEKIAERDQRISDLERLLDCMAQEKSQLIQKLCDCEKRLQNLDEVDSRVNKKSEQVRLQKEASELRERIKHLNDMVFCQQRKVKGMIEEVEMLRASVAQKDMYISELLDRIAIVECENNELEDKLKYFMSVQNTTVNKPLTRDIGVGCDLPIRRFIQSLPDKGKKISDFAEKVRQALVDLEEEEKKRASLSAIETEFQARYQQAFTQSRHEDSSASERKTVEKDKVSLENPNARPANVLGANSRVDRSTEMMEADCGDGAASVTAAAGKDTDLTEALARVTLSEGKTGRVKDTAKNSPPRNPFSATQSQKKPHYMEVLEKSDRNMRKGRFKPNQLPEKSDSSSPGQSPGSTTPLSAEARRQRDRKHLDDVTAAKLPPLHHSPAQLLSLEESVSIQLEQTRKQQELQAKLAAQKLAEGLAVSMSSYNPEGGALAAYREVHDDGALSDED